MYKIFPYSLSLWHQIKEKSLNFDIKLANRVFFLILFSLYLRFQTKSRMMVFIKTRTCVLKLYIYRYLFLSFYQIHSLFFFLGKTSIIGRYTEGKSILIIFISKDIDKYNFLHLL